MDALRGKNLNDDDRQGEGIDMQVVRMRGADDITDVLPTVYNPVRLEAYFSKRPGAVFTRIWQVAYASSSLAFGILFDFITGNTDNVEVKRAVQLRNTIVSLGPFFIKLGQALSIRPDILSPKAMVELQQLCDKVSIGSRHLCAVTIYPSIIKIILIKETCHNHYTITTNHPHITHLSLSHIKTSHHHVTHITHPQHPQVPCFDSALAMKTIEEELGRPPSEIFSAMTPEPVAAASLGQVKGCFYCCYCYD